MRADDADTPAHGDRRRPDYQALRAGGRRMLTVKQTAWFMATTAAIVRRLIAAGELHAVKYSPRNTRISEGEIAAFLDRGMRGPRRDEVPRSAP